MGTRDQLHQILKGITDNVYFQPPEGIKMKYPCIVYTRNKLNTEHADNNPYRITKGYSLTVMYAHPDSDLSAKVALLPTASLERNFRSKNVYHDVFNIYY